jgi:hypothetical protein
VNRGTARRRLRLRRKRKDETFSKVLDAPDAVEVADAVGDWDVLSGADGAEVVQVVGHMGCCVVEAVGSLAVLLALLTVPAYFMLR